MVELTYNHLVWLVLLSWTAPTAGGCNNPTARWWQRGIGRRLGYFGLIEQLSCWASRPSQNQLNRGWIWVQPNRANKAQTFCDTGWHRQPSMDHNLYTKWLYGLTRRSSLTSSNKTLWQHNNTIQEHTTLSSLVASLALNFLTCSLLALPPLFLHAHGWMPWQRKRSLFIGQREYDI